jgi:hypothetical protein
VVVTPHSATIIHRFDQLDRVLQSKGFPATSPWWRSTIERWYAGGKRQMVARVGRRGGKSSTLCRLAVVEAIYGGHEVPPGDIGVVAIVSARRPDALERLRTIAAILDAIGMKYEERGDSLYLASKRVVFTVFTASIAGVSGFTGIFILLDEVAKWRDSDTGANPAQQVIVSIRPTIATQPEARIAIISSPMGLLDAHADAFALGDTALQTTAYAATWDANPTVSEEYTRTLEPDEMVWQREYKAIPQAENELSLLTDHALSKLVRALRQPAANEPEMFTAFDLLPDPRHKYLATIDPATRGNAWTLSVCALSDERVRRVCMTREWRGTKNKPLKAGDVFKEIAQLIRPYGLRHVHSDQFSEDTLREIAAQHDVFLIVDTPWSAATKADAYDGLATLVREKLLEIPPSAVVKTDLLGIRTKLTRSGVVYELATQGPRHSDFAPCIAMAVMLAKVPPSMLAEQLSLAERSERVKKSFLQDREKERKKSEKRGRLPPTHR